MAIGVSKETTKIGIKQESTEGTWEAPDATTAYIQPLDGGYSITGAKELKERNILTAGYQMARARVGKRTAEFTLNVEMRGSGTEGGQTDFHPLLKNMLGANRSSATRVTSSTGHTTSVINMADTSAFNVGDIVCVLESGAHHVSPITAVTTNTSITLLRAAGSSFSDSVEISKFQTYYPSNTESDYASLSLSFYHGDEILEKGIGMRPSSMALSGFETGGLASLEFSGSGTDFDRIDGSAPHTPDYDSGTPPLILGACLYRNGTQLAVNDFSFSIEHANGELPSTCSSTGVLSNRKVGKRKITGSFTPYMDDSDVSRFDDFKDNTAFSIFVFAANPSSTAGELELGSIVGFYFPTCIASGDTVADLDGVLQTPIEFSADGGTAGEDNEIYMGII